MDSKTCSTCNETKPITKFSKDKTRKDGLRYSCKDCINGWNKEYYAADRERINKQRREHYRANKEQKREYAKNRYANDESFRIMTNLRARLRHALSAQSARKSLSTLGLTGCTIDELKEHLESQFINGMTWDNYSFEGWHVDHIVPCAVFDLTNPEQQKLCFHYTNLQPLWAKDNRTKYAKLPHELSAIQA